MTKLIKNLDEVLDLIEIAGRQLGQTAHFAGSLVEADRQLDLATAKLEAIKEDFLVLSLSGVTPEEVEGPDMFSSEGYDADNEESAEYFSGE